MTISEMLLYSTVRIETTTVDGMIVTGTGYFFRFLDRGDEYVPSIVTNKHVLENGKSIKIWLHLRSNETREVLSDSIEVIVDDVSKYCFPHPDPSIDLCVVFISPIVSKLSLKNRSIYFAGLSQDLIPTPEEEDDFVAIEEIIMIGYPNGIWDSKNNMPIVRRGITATYLSLNYEGRHEFLIDAACFPGSSGSPVFLYNQIYQQTKSKGTVLGQGRIKLLGTLYAGPQHSARGEIKVVTVPSAQKAIPEVLIPNNLGFVIKANQLQIFNEILRVLMK